MDEDADEPASVIDDAWPKGPYTQQVEGVLPPIFTDTDSVILSHLQKSGKQLKAKSTDHMQDDAIIQHFKEVTNISWRAIFLVNM